MFNSKQSYNRALMLTGMYSRGVHWYVCVCVCVCTCTWPPKKKKNHGMAEDFVSYPSCIKLTRNVIKSLSKMAVGSDDLTSAHTCIYIHTHTHTHTHTQCEKFGKMLSTHNTHFRSIFFIHKRAEIVNSARKLEIGQVVLIKIAWKISVVISQPFHFSVCVC